MRREDGEVVYRLVLILKTPHKNILFKYVLFKRKLKLQGDQMVERKREILFVNSCFIDCYFCDSSAFLC